MNKESLKFAGTYISICIGSGFATGQEIMQFFSSHGIISILSNILCMIFMCYCGVSLLSIGKNENFRENNDIFNYLCGDYLGKFMKICMPLLFFLSFIVMISGAGASINQYYGVNKWIGSLLISLLSLISVILGMNKIISILGNIGPLIAIFSIIIGLITIFKNYENLHIISESLKSININKVGVNWYLGSIMYVGLNLVLVAPFLVGVGKSAKYKKSCFYGGLIGGILFMVSAMILNLAIMSDIKNIYLKEIPTLFMAKEISNIVGIIFSIILILGIYTTATPLLFSICSSFSPEKTKKFNIIAFFVTIISLIFSNISFSMLVNIIYPLSGLLGIIIFSGLIIKGVENYFVKLSKSKRLLNISRKNY